jgi:hypothetical protein
MLLTLLVSAPLLVLWIVMSHDGRTRWTVAGIIAALAVVAGTMIRLLPRGTVEISLACLILTVAVVIAGRMAERRAGTARRRPVTFVLAT